MQPSSIEHDALGLYIHFPWCVKKCPYCDFNSHPIKQDTDQEAYLAALLADWREQYTLLGERRLAQTPTASFTSIFFGGGTPSLFKPELLKQLMDGIPHEGSEVTLEVNPGTAEYHSFKDYRLAGINRLSLGAQSFSDGQLAALGRVHQSRDTQTAFHQARQAGFANINLDLMWALPGQNVEAALEDLRQAIELQPEHISWYQLTIEAKTEFAKRPPILPVDRTIQEIEEAGLALLADAGYRRYEISAFAKPTKECRHNLNYWSFGDYFGIGAGAHGKVSTPEQIVRTTRPSQPRLYQLDSTTIEPVEVTRDQRVLEFMMNALRLVDGVDFPIFNERTQLSWERVQTQWDSLVALDLVHKDKCATTPLGLRYLDSVLARLL